MTDHSSEISAADTPESRLAAEGIYSDVPEVNRRLFETLDALQSAGFQFIDATPIAYGSKLTLEHTGKSLSASIYYSSKRGISVVIPPNIPKTISDQLRGILLAPPSAQTETVRGEESRYASWIGADEAGKGDFMGPLVTAAFFITREMLPEIRGMGVRDSKMIRNDECRAIARRLFLTYRNHIALTALPPETYNRLYSDFSAEGKSLNALLAWAHGKSIGSLLNRKPEAVILDRFAAESMIRRYIRTDCPLIARPRAEDNSAVAAASILARAHYLHTLEQLSKTFDIDLVSGSGESADEAARAIFRRHGEEGLARSIKLHFKNTQRVIGLK